MADSGDITRYLKVLHTIAIEHSLRVRIRKSQCRRRSRVQPVSNYLSRRRVSIPTAATLHVVVVVVWCDKSARVPAWVDSTRTSATLELPIPSGPA